MSLTYFSGETYTTTAREPSIYEMEQVIKGVSQIKQVNNLPSIICVIYLAVIVKLHKIYIPMRKYLCERFCF